MSERPDPTKYFDVLECVEDMGDGTVREHWARMYRDYESDLWYTIREEKAA